MAAPRRCKLASIDYNEYTRMTTSLALLSRAFQGARVRKAAALLALAAGLGAGAAQAQDLYINATVGGAIAPGVYGQINFGSQPPPPVLYAQPVIIQRQAVQGPPLYLYVPPGHAKNWGKHCRHYNACGRPVYFVQVNEQNRWWDGRHDEHRGRDKFDKHDKHGRDDHGKGRGHGNRKFED